MDSNGDLFVKQPQVLKSPLYVQYEQLRKNDFADVDSFDTDQLNWIQHIHDKHLDFYKEERRMHFGAFALTAVAFFILFPAMLTIESYFLPLAAIELLLLVLLVPYTFVYRKYEEGVRKMMRHSIILEIARRSQTNSETTSPPVVP